MQPRPRLAPTLENRPESASLGYRIGAGHLGGYRGERPQPLQQILRKSPQAPATPTT
jgi:hypothetical protein